MKKVVYMSLIVSCLGISFIGSGLFSNNPLPTKDTLAIVELKDELGESEESRKVVLQKFKAELTSSVGYNFNVENNLTEIGNFVFVKVNHDALETLKGLDTVRSVTKNNTYVTQSIKEDTETFATTSDIPDNYSRLDMSADGSTNQGKGTLIAILDNYFQLNHECFTDLPDASVKYKKSEIENVATEKTLSAKGTTYYNNKIPFYYDYADKDNTLTPSTATADNTHGIHVASIAAANGTYTGIAPNAQVALMKISSDDKTGSASDETILTALNDAVKIGADVINLSFGSPIIEDSKIREKEEDETSTGFEHAIKNLTEKGVIMSISAGNEGKGSYIKDNVQTNDYGDYSNNTFDMVDTGIIGSFADTKYGTVVASSRLSAKYDSTVQKSSLYTQKVSGFSSEGPTFDLGLNPDIITPGENIYGGVYYSNSDSTAKKYELMSGTSMAAPNYTGVVASILSDTSATTAEERVAYQKTLTERIQSTAELIVQSNGAYYTPRKQGAGQPNIAKAVKCDTYLEGVNNKAKIELKNDENISTGHIKFTVKTHNETANSKKYTAKLSVECPATAKDDTEVSLFNTLIGDKEQEVTIPSGEGSFDIDYTVDSASKAILNKFTNGTYLEGYVVLTPTDSTDNTLSIPYMGFYGDYSQAECVGRFDFEATDSSALTGSDILNSAYKTNLSKANVDFESTIVSSKDSILGNFSSVVSGDTNLKLFGKPILRTDDKLNVGIKNLSNYISIQQVIYRNIDNNKVEIIDSSNNVVDTYTLSNLNEDKNYTFNDGTLLKSLILLNDKGTITCSKAMLEIQFVKSDGSLVYPVGDYTLKFTYNLAYGSTIIKSYPLAIKGGEAQIPVIGKKVVDEAGTNVRIDLESNVSSVTLNGDLYDVKEDSNGKYVEFSKATYASKGKVLLVATNEFTMQTTQLFNLNEIDTTGFSVENSLLKSTYTPSLETTTSEVDENHRYTVTYQTKITDARGNPINAITKYLVNVKLPSNANITPTAEITLADLISVKETGYDGTINDISYTLHDGYITYETSSGNVAVTYTQDQNQGSDINLGLIIGISVGAVVVIGAVITTIIIIKKKKAKKNV